ncbi:MAG: hypothetical protein ACRDT6_15055 [Micromonosporaceae bacterium]
MTGLLSPIGYVVLLAVSSLGFAAGGLIYGPFSAICTGLFQRLTPPQALSRVLAARSALTIPSTALGTLLGGPLVSAVGGRPTLLLSALLTIALGVSVAGVVWLRYRAATGPVSMVVIGQPTEWFAGRSRVGGVRR